MAYNANSSHKWYIGEADKQRRKCRFCGCSGKDNITFSKIAHAIPEALGNKTIILNEECDTCNEYFGNSIEKEFINYIDILRTIFAVPNKENKIPELEGENFKITNDGKHNISVFIQDDISLKFPNQFVLKCKNKVVFQNIYKALVLFCVRIMRGEYLHFFDETISWVRFSSFKDKLPKIAIMSDMNFFVEKPFVMTYIRKTDNNSIPRAVGMFCFLSYTYVFIIPTFAIDETDFTDENNYEVFWKEFNLYYQIKSFYFLDMSDTTKKSIQVNISFIKNAPL